MSLSSGPFAASKITHCPIQEIESDRPRLVAGSQATGLHYWVAARQDLVWSALP